MSMAADWQYLAVSRQVEMLKQDDTVESKPPAQIDGSTRKPHTLVLAGTCKLIIAAMIISLVVGAAIARAGMKTYFPRAAPYMLVQSLQPIW